MNFKIPPNYKELIDLSIIAFRAAHKGPDLEGDDRNAPTLNDYIAVVQGNKLNMHGVATGHPRLGTTFLRTSMLIYVTDDEQWARTLSRWYRLETPRLVDTSQAFPDIDVAGYCQPIGLEGVGIPMHLARLIMARRPGNLARVALDVGYDDAAATLSLIENKWPPKI